MKNVVGHPEKDVGNLYDLVDLWKIHFDTRTRMLHLLLSLGNYGKRAWTTGQGCWTPYPIQSLARLTHICFTYDSMAEKRWGDGKTLYNWAEIR